MAKNESPAVDNPLTSKPAGMRFPIVALGASAGGLEAFETFFRAMPNDSGCGFVLVSHLDPTHVSLLPELVQKHTKMPVHQVRDGTQVQRNQVYVIPPNKELTILNGVLQLMDFNQPRGVNLPIDSFFRSLAADQGPNAVCIILSGTGTDGTLGLKAIKGGVGMVMVQSEESAKYDGMPHSAISTGLADFVLPPEKMPEQLINYTRHASRQIMPGVVLADDAIPSALQKIYVILRRQTDHDFSQYKKNTICRRIQRRMNLHQIDDIAEYASYLQRNKIEVEILFRELLIGVTNFFRDSEAFDTLRDNFLDKLLDGKPDGYTLRVWSAGCSTGEEAYSLAILLQESMDRIKRHFNVQIFGTDIDEAAINVARAGRYPTSILADVAPDRLQRHFTQEDDGHYRIKKAVREMLVFAPQNVIRDPPFTKLDVLSCRNLLIYLDAELQKKLMPTFHYSLKPDGILFLGSSESIGQTTDQFEMLDKKWKIYRRRPSGVGAHPLLSLHAAPVTASFPESEGSAGVRRAEEISALQLVETILQQSNTPPCAIIDGACNVIYIHGRTGEFLEPAEGKISINILEMARSDLRPTLTTAVRDVVTHKRDVIHRDLRINGRGGSLFFNLSVKPILQQSVVRGLMVVMFEQIPAPSTAKTASDSQIVPEITSSRSVEELERDLQYTRENLQTTIEELETSNEELKSINEELQSTNEELQSTNEEMETSKEELQSLNEESITVNVELQSRIEELSKANDDMKNLLDSTDAATVFLDIDLCVRRFTPRANEILPLTSVDLGRPIKHFATSLIETNLAEIGGKVLEDLVVRDSEVRSQDGHIYALKVCPYRTTRNVIDGVVITIENITQRKREAESLRQAAARLQALVESIPVWSWEINAQWVYAYVSPQVQGMLGYKPQEIVGKTLLDLMPPDEAKRVAEIFKEASGTGKPIDVCEMVYLHKDNRHVVLETHGVAFFDAAGKLAGYRGMNREVRAGRVES